MTAADEARKEEYRRMLMRVAWNLQYRARRQLVRERPLYDNVYGTDVMESVIADCFVDELIGMIPSQKGRYIIRRVVLDGCTEKEVAVHLNMTQQGVHKCKKKWLRVLRQHLTHS